MLNITKTHLQPGRNGGNSPKHPARGDRRWIGLEVERAAQVALTQEMIAMALGVPLIDLRASTRRQAPVAFARQVAMYLTHVVFGFSLSAVGRHFERDRTTAAHACRQIEDLRDDANFDLMIDRLECAMRAMPLTYKLQ